MARISKVTSAAGGAEAKASNFRNRDFAQWRRERLKHEVILLSPEQRMIVELHCQLHCEHRGWKLWEISARSNHVHAVVTAVGRSGGTVRDELKANSTRGLREHSTVFRDRPIWTVGGDWMCINSEGELETVCMYVREAQDRKQASQD